MAHHTLNTEHGTADYSEIRNIRAAFFLNLTFTIIEIIGGILTNSVAILSDALHDFGDSISIGAAWFFQKLSGRGRDEKYSYGYKRFTVLGAIINSLVLLTGSAVILTEAIPRLLNPVQPRVEGMIILAVLGITINGLAVFRLKKSENLNQKVIYLHLLEDVLGWFAVLIGSIVMYFTYLPVLDPILSILISLYILYNVIKNLRESLKIVLQAIPRNIDLTKIEEHIIKLSKVDEIHDVHLWTMDGNYNVLTIHVVLKSELNFTEQWTLKREIRGVLKQNNIDHSTIEFESMDEKCEMADC
ncbi:cation diffusion facilitator family transporter [Bacteroidota bacterium]